MENGYPLAVRREEDVGPGELRLLSIVAREWELYWVSVQVGAT